MIPGREIILGQKCYIAPPLTLGSLERLQDRLGHFGQNPVEDAGLVIDVVHAALIRNYPELTRETISETLDVSNMMSAMEAVMGVSMLESKDSSTDTDLKAKAKTGESEAESR